MVRRTQREPLDQKATERHLLVMEGLGVLDRDICYHPILTDEEQAGTVKAPRAIPPRLFYVPSLHILVHCYGDDKFYSSHPEYQPGGLSLECYMLSTTPRHLDNYYAMEDTYRGAGAIGDGKDKLSMRATAPAPITGAEFREMRRIARQRGQDRLLSKGPKLQLVE